MAANYQNFHLKTFHFQTFPCLKRLKILIFFIVEVNDRNHVTLNLFTLALLLSIDNSAKLAKTTKEERLRSPHPHSQLMKS